MGKTDPMLVALGGYLRSVREKKGLSQEALSFDCGLHRTYIGAVERGEYNVTLLTLRKITRALGITVLDAVRGMSRRATTDQRRSRRRK
jgi:transcriptional regulator with XRE-family HTH domain